MSVRIGGSAGPFFVSTRVSPTKNEAGGCLGFVVVVIIGFVAVVVLGPLAAVGFAIWMWATRSRRSTAVLTGSTILAVGAVVFAFWYWPMAYTTIRYTENIPHTSGASVADYTDRLTDDGFTNIEVVPAGPIEDGLNDRPARDCRVIEVFPDAGEQVDTRDRVIVSADCGRP